MTGVQTCALPISLDEPFPGLRPIPARAHSAPLTRPLEPLEPSPSPALVPTRPTATQPQSADAFRSHSWSKSQWIAFNDDIVPVRRQTISGGGVRDPPRPQSIPPTSPPSGRPPRFFSDDPADPYNRVSLGSGDRVRLGEPNSTTGDQDIYAPLAAATISQIANGNKQHGSCCTVCLGQVV